MADRARDRAGCAPNRSASTPASRDFLSTSGRYSIVFGQAYAIVNIALRD